VALKSVNTFLSGSVLLPGDKSVSHRALIFPALIAGEFKVNGALASLDCLATARAMQTIGLDIEGLPTEPGGRCRLTIKSPGLEGLRKTVQGREIVIDAGNSGTTVRLLSGLCAGLPATFVFDGDASLRRRDMNRVLEPLQMMGAEVTYLGEPGYVPFKIKGGSLKSRIFSLDIDSAQVSTALLLAGAQAKGRTAVSTRHLIRDHTPRLLSYLGLPVEENGLTLAISSGSAEPMGHLIEVPADISSAAFFMVAAALLPGSLLVLPGCGVNPGRRLVIDVLRSMGASIELTKERMFGEEPVADIVVSYKGPLYGVAVDAHQIASGIDELPVLALAFAFAQGISEVHGAAELTHKESDRLTMISRNLAMLGAIVECSEDGFAVLGGLPLSRKVGLWKTERDHRIAMTGLIAQLICGALEVDDAHCVDVSYPGFGADLDAVARRSAH
jgi:3-phosphoshikimate 1-carboxyvinyltransferase